MKVLVTGASGLIGRHTVELLHEQGATVRTLHRGGALDGVEHVAGDVRSATRALAMAALGCDAVVHLAGRGDVGESRQDPLGYVDLNSIGALHALEAASAAGAAFVLASTQRVYALRPELCYESDAPEPDSPYGYAKWTAELWCRMESELRGISATVLRFFSVYGPGQAAKGGSGVVSIFARAALAGEPLVVQSAGKRDFTDARDAALGIWCAVESPREGFHVYNVGTGVGTSFGDLARQIVALAQSRSSIEEELTEETGRNLVPDIRCAQRDLGFTPRIDLTAGLAHYLDALGAEGVP